MTAENNPTPPPFSPAPWTPRIWDWGMYEDANGKAIVKVWQIMPGTPADDTMTRANHRLISKAPETIESLIQVNAELDNWLHVIGEASKDPELSQMDSAILEQKVSRSRATLQKAQQLVKEILGYEPESHTRLAILNTGENHD